MRRLLILVCLLAIAAAGRTVRAQHLTYEEWLHRAMADMRLEPCYGSREKNGDQRASDAEFVRAVLAVDSVPRSASQRLADHGTALLREGDLAQAMMRFNQAWLVDSLNPSAYWGFGTFFMELDRPAMALVWYRRGLAVDSASTRLLDGMAAALLAQVHGAPAGSAERADLLSAALAVLERALAIDPGDASLLHRRAACHLLRGDCAEAREWHQRCLQRPGCPRDGAFEEQLRVRCR